MSILKSTKTGYKYYYVKDIIKNCCTFSLNGNEVDYVAEIDNDNVVTLKPSENTAYRMKLYTKFLQKDDTIKYPTVRWFDTMPMVNMPYIGISDNYILTIKEPLISSKIFRFNEIFANIKIECEIPNITDIFNKTKIYGNVEIKDELQNIYNDKFLIENCICPYYGEKFMGF